MCVCVCVCVKGIVCEIEVYICAVSEYLRMNEVMSGETWAGSGGMGVPDPIWKMAASGGWSALWERHCHSPTYPPSH